MNEYFFSLCGWKSARIFARNGCLLRTPMSCSSNNGTPYCPRCFRLPACRPISVVFPKPVMPPFQSRCCAQARLIIPRPEILPASSLFLFHAMQTLMLHRVVGPWCSSVGHPAVLRPSSAVCAGSLELAATQMSSCGNDTACITQQAAAVFRPCLRCLKTSGQSAESCFLGQALPFNVSGVSRAGDGARGRRALESGAVRSHPNCRGGNLAFEHTWLRSLPLECAVPTPLPGSRKAWLRGSCLFSLSWPVRRQMRTGSHQWLRLNEIDHVPVRGFLFLWQVWHSCHLGCIRLPSTRSSRS